MNVKDFLPAPRKNGLCYPGKRCSTSYILHDDNVILLDVTKSLGDSYLLDMDDMTLDKFLSEHNTSLKNRVYVMGYGSNSCPAQLYDKFHIGIIPVIKGEISGYDVVYANHITKYGSIPATLYKSPFTIVEVWCTILTRDQLTIMNKSEGLSKSYDMVKLNYDYKLDDGMFYPSYTYIAKKGAFNYNNKPIRISDVHAKYSLYGLGMNQMEILELYSKMIGANRSAENQIYDNIINNIGNRDKLENISNGLRCMDCEIISPDDI